MAVSILEKKEKEENIITNPIVKWVGGKRQLMNELLNSMPNSYNRYFEPFIGGGALFFRLQPKGAYISDMNPDLINLYNVVKDNVEDLIEDLKIYKNEKDYFLKIRELDRSEDYQNLSPIRKASRFIYLNRTCFNGLYRVNSKGFFNVPFGSYTNPKILDATNLYNCSKILQDTTIRQADFSEILAEVKENDFVYFDPPYVPLNITSSFTSYTRDGFDIDSQIRLRDVCKELDRIGAKFMLSNSDTQIIHELYNDFNIKKVLASRQVNSKAECRGKITEVIVRNFE